jgi:protease-4
MPNVAELPAPGRAAITGNAIRRIVLEQSKRANVGHIGCALSVADLIVASPGTITGSIGIFGIVPTFEDSLASIGVTRDGVASAPLAGGLDPFGGISDAMGNILQANVEAGYKRFLDLVSRGRDMLPEQVDKIGQGRVWTGRKAHELGLVDFQQLVPPLIDRLQLTPIHKTFQRVDLRFGDDRE